MAAQPYWLGDPQATPIAAMPAQPQPSPTKQGAHQPQPSNTSPVSAGDHVAGPSTPVRRPLETPGRHTRRRQQKINVQTLPGTRWDELEIERQRESQGGQGLPSDLTNIPTVRKLPLYENSAHASSRRSISPGDFNLIPAAIQPRSPAQQSGTLLLGPCEEPTKQLPASGPSPTKGSRPIRRRQAKKHRAPSERRGKSAPGTGIITQSPFLFANCSAGQDLLSIMARRPGRNQVDYVAELKETIHESLSKLSDIQEKLIPLGQQIVSLEEELKAKESNSSKLEQPLILLIWLGRDSC